MPISSLTPSTSFNQFLLAAYAAQADDRLIFNNGDVSVVSKNYRFSEQENEINKKTWSAFARAINKAFLPEKIDWICQRYFGKNHLEDLISSSRGLEKHHVESFGVGAASVTLSDLKGAASAILSELEKTLEEFQPWYNSHCWTDASKEKLEKLKTEIGRWREISAKDLRECSLDEVKTLYERARAHGHLIYQDPHHISGSPREMLENFVFSPFKMDQQRCNLFQGIPDLLSKDPQIPRLHPYYQRLSMTITCLFENPSKAADPEFIIPAPGAREGEVDFYRVYKIISDGGLTAVALVPVSDSSTLQPIISFRCTKQALWQKGFFDSNLDNMGKEMGRMGFEACREKLRELIADPQFSRGKRVKVLAYSQGGGYAGHFLNNVIGQYWRKIDEFIGFNYIGNDDPKAPENESPRVVDGFANQMNAIPKGEDPPKITVHRNIGDWVNGSQNRHLGWGVHHPNSSVRVFEWKIDDFPMPEKNPYDDTQKNLWFNIHGARPMDSKRTYTYDLYQGPTQCDPILDTYKRDPILEDIRQKYGHEVLYRSISIVLRIIDLIARTFGINFLKKYVEGHATRKPLAS